MNVIELIKDVDPSLKFLVHKYLLNQEIEQTNQGFIDQYLSLFDLKKQTWGNGIYGPKWISTHYMMLELRYLEIKKDHPIYQQGMKTLLDHLWNHQGMYNKVRKVDLCIAGMLLHICCYGNSKSEKIFEIIDYILNQQFSDGGWNCMWDSGKNPKISSLHTTINVLEGLRDYINFGYDYKTDLVKKAIDEGAKLLLRRKLFKSFSTKTVIHPSMIEPHYPPRWKYDILRALDFFDSVSYPYDLSMKDALDIIASQIKNGLMPKGTTISGLVHFKLEKNNFGAFNTLRALKIFKRYRNEYYQALIQINQKK